MIILASILDQLDGLPPLSPLSSQKPSHAPNKSNHNYNDAYSESQHIYIQVFGKFKFHLDHARDKNVYKDILDPMIQLYEQIDE